MLKGQDIILLLMLRIKPDQGWTYPLLSSESGLSVSQCHAAVQRLRASGLLSPEHSNPWRVPEGNCLEFLQYGLKYFFPAEIGPEARGIPTAGSANFVKKHFASLPGKLSDFVWPDPNGDSLGSGIQPIHPCQLQFAPQAAENVFKDFALYESLVCIDLIRMGRVREKAWAIGELKSRLHASR
jgi:hypothetical protein